MDESIEAKQAYLRENILEKNYDADEFMSFLQMKKGENGLDLSNWAMKDLMKVVDEFIHDKNKGNVPEEAINPSINKINDIEDEGEKNINENNNEIKESTNSNIINEEDDTQENNIHENDNNIQENKENDIQENDIQENNIHENNQEMSQPKEEIIEIEKCLKPDSSPLSNIEKIDVKLSSPKKLKEGIFSKSFISYVVTTDPLDYKTTKRYSDFSALRNKLSMIYPNCVLPPLCKKNYGDRFTDALISKRMRSISKFMQGITIHPVIRNCELLNLFLSVEKKNDFKNQIKKYEKIKKPQTDIKKMVTIDGLINLGISKEKEIYLDNIKNYCQGNSYILQKITKAYKSLMYIMSQLSDKMKSISQLFKQLLDKSIKYYDSHNTSETFNIMSQFMSEWAKIQQNQIKITNENIREYFRYVKNEFNSLKEMANKVTIYKTNYTKAHDKLLATKEALFQKPDPTAASWHLKKEDKNDLEKLKTNKQLAFSKMLPDDTKKVTDLKRFYGCMLNSLINEFERIRKVNAKRHKENITNFIRELSIECTNMHICLADRLSEFNQLKDENDVHNIDGGIQLKKVENLNEVPNDENNNNIHEENNINNNEFDFENNDNVDEEEINKNIKDKEKNIEEEKIDKKNDNIKEEIIEEKKDDEEKKEEKKEETKIEENKKEEIKKEEEKKEEIKKEEIKKEENKIEEEKKEEDKKEDKKDEKKEEIKKEETKKEDNKIEENKKEEDKKDENKDKKEENEIKDDSKEK